MFTNRGFTRATAVAAAVCMLVVVAPQTSVAKVDNLWSVWASEVTDRSKAEIPFVILTSLPAMLVSTPFWLGVWSLDKYKNREGGERSMEAAQRAEDEAEAEANAMEDEAEATGSDTPEESGVDAESDASASEAAGSDTAEAEAGADADATEAEAETGADADEAEAETKADE
jgi:hypothetical protein